MPYSYVQYTGTGTAPLLSVPFPYLLKSHVHIYIGYNLLTDTFQSELIDGAAFTWVSATQVQLSTIAAGTLLTIIRKTPTSTRLVDWNDASNLLAGDMDTADLQNLYAVQEQQDRVVQAAAVADAANEAISDVLVYAPIANVASIPGSPTNGDRIELTDSTGIENFSPLAGRPAGFVGSNQLRVRMYWNSASNAWIWGSYYTVDPDGRYVRQSSISNSVSSTSQTTVASSLAVKTAKDAADAADAAAATAQAAAATAQAAATSAASAASTAQATANGKLTDSCATDRVLGRSSAGIGPVEQITLTAAGRALMDDADAAAQRATLGLSTVANTGSYADLTGKPTIPSIAARSDINGVHTTGSVTSGTASLTVASATGIVTGMVVTGEGITPGTTVSSISGTTVTLSANAGATLSSDPVGFYDNAKALSPGSVGGQLCRAWVNFDGTGTVAIRASYNVSSITDNGVGDYTVNFTTAMPDAKYSAVFSANYQDASGSNLYGLTASRSLLSSSCRFVTGPENISFATWVAGDNATLCVAIFR